MNDVDVLADRLHQLGQRAPVPVADPLLDLRRGRTALRRRHVRSAAGVTSALVAVGAVAASVQALNGPAESPSGASSAVPTPTAEGTDECDGLLASTSVGASRGAEVTPEGTGDDSYAPSPEIAAALADYRATAAEILDPAGEHLDADKRLDNVQTGSYCDPETGLRLTSLSTKIGWKAGPGLGVVQLEAVAPGNDGPPQIVIDHDGWVGYDGQLPEGVASARVTEYAEDGGGHAVVVERTDGLTVAVDAAGVWGNNAAPGSPSATDLPGIDELLTLAASPRLTVPTVS